MSGEKLSYLMSQPTKQPRMDSRELSFEDTIENHLTLMLMQKKRTLTRGAFPYLDWNKFNRVIFDAYEIQEEIYTYSAMVKFILNKDMKKFKIETNTEDRGNFTRFFEDRFEQNDFIKFQHPEPESFNFAIQKMIKIDADV